MVFELQPIIIQHEFISVVYTQCNLTLHVKGMCNWLQHWQEDDVSDIVNTSPIFAWIPLWPSNDFIHCLHILWYKFDVLACDVIPEFSAYCFSICHPTVVSLPTTFSHGKGTASIEVQVAAASLFLQFDDAHAWYKCLQTLLVLYTTCTSDICVTPLLKVLATGVHNTILP